MIRLEKHKTKEQRAKALYDEWRGRFDYMARYYHRGWLLDLYSYQGRQFLRSYVQGTVPGIEYVKRRGRRMRVGINKILPGITRVGAAFSRSEPGVVHVPGGPEPEDIASARTADYLTDFIWKEQDTPELYEQLGLIVPLFGTAFWRTYWESDWGETLGELLQEKMARAIGRGEDVTELERLIAELAKGGPNLLETRCGRPADCVEYPQSVFLNIGATSDRKTWRDYFVAKMMPLSWFEEHFPEAKVLPMSEQTVFQFLSPLSGLRKGSLAPDSERNEWALLLEYRMKATKTYPRGRVCLVAGEKPVMLEDRDSEFPDGRLGLHAVWWRREPFSAYGMSLTREMRPAQIEYSQARGDIASYRELGKGRWLAIQQAGIDLKGDPLAEVNYDIAALQGTNRAPLEWVGPARVPPLLLESVKLAKQDMQEAMSDHAEALAAGEPKTRSALEYDMRIETDDRGKWNIPSQLRRLEVNATRDKTYLAQKNWPVPVPIRILGEGNTADVIEFDAANIKQSLDVRVKQVGQRPISQALHEERMTRLFDRGVFGDPRPGSPNHRFAVVDYARAVGVKSDSFLYRLMVQAENQAREETLAMLIGGRPMPVMPWHDHAVHIRTHDMMANQRQYRNVPPERWQLLLAHREQHIQHMPQTLEAQVQQLQQVATEQQQRLQAAQAELEIKGVEADAREKQAADIARIQQEEEAALAREEG